VPLLAACLLGCSTPILLHPQPYDADFEGELNGDDDDVNLKGDVQGGITKDPASRAV